jgi:hypothetical protein
MDRFDARRAGRGHIQGRRSGKELKRILCNTLRIFADRERRRGPRIVCRSGRISLGRFLSTGNLQLLSFGVFLQAGKDHPTSRRL